MATQNFDNCSLAAQPRFRPTCPSVTARKKGKRCLNSNRIRNYLPNTGPHPTVRAHQHPSATNYFTHMEFLTPNDLADPNAHSAFMRAVDHVRPCLSAHGPGHNNFEVVIVLRCISQQSLKFYYYIADHQQQTIRWNHQGLIPREVALSDSPPMRNDAEYWYHRNRFPMHRLCTQADLDSLAGQLNGLNPNNAVMSTEEIQARLRELSQLSSLSTDVLATCRITEIYVDFFRRSLPGFDNAQEESKLKKTLYGLFKMFHPAVHSGTPASSPRSSQVSYHDESP